MSSSLQLELHNVMGYNGSHVSSLGKGDICYGIATGISFYNYKSGQRSFHCLDNMYPRPVTCVRFCAKTNVLAISERKLNPTITFLQLADKRVVQKLESTAKTEYVDFAFSRDATYFAALSGVPDCVLSVYSLNGTQYQLVARNTELRHQATYLSFNPRIPTELCTSGAGHLTFWRVEKIQSAMTLVPTEAKLDPSVTDVRLYCHSWLPTGEVLSGSYAGEVYKFDVSTGKGELVPEAGSMDMVIGILVTLRHVLVATMDGTVRFLSSDLSKVEKTFQVPTRSLSTIHFTQEWNTLILGGTDGSLIAVYLSGYERPTISDEEFSLIQPKVHVLGDYSGKPLVGVVSLPGDMCITVSEDGIMRTWDYNANTLISKIHVGNNPTAVEMGAGSTSFLLYVGSAAGTLRMYNVGTPQSSKQVFREKLNNKPITAIRAHPMGKFIVVALEKNQIYFVHAQDQAILGQICIGEETMINDVAWLGSLVHPQCLVSQKNGDIHLLTCPPEPSQEYDYGLSSEEVVQNMWKLDFPAKCIYSMAVFEDTLNLLAMSVDKDTKLYILDLKTHSDYKEPKFKELRPSAVYPDHKKVGNSITVSERKPIMLTAGTDGKICLRDCTSLTQQNPGSFRDAGTSFGIQRHSPYGKGVCSACFVKSEKLVVLSAGWDGVLMVWKAPGAEKRDTAPFSILAQETTINEDAEEEYDFIEKRKIQADNLVMLQNEGFRNNIREKIASIAANMKALRIQNESVPELEKLTVQEFMVRRQLEDLHRQGDQDIEKAKDDIHWANLRRDWLVDMIKKECWESTEAKLTVARGMLNDDVEVPNFVIPRRSKKDMLLLRKIKFLRKVEMTERQVRGERDPLDKMYEPLPGEEEEEDGRMSSAMRPDSPSDTSRNITPAPAAPAAPPAGGEEESAPKPTKSLQEDTDEPVDGYLYHEYMCYTRQRIIIQSNLLLNTITLLKKQFNAKFTESQRRKKNEIEKILEKNLRIRQILKELDEKAELYVPTFALSEKPEKLLEVTDAEIGLDKSLDPESRKNLENEVEAERRRKAAADDSSDKALYKWMDGKLEKDERALEIKIDMPAFADPTAEGHIPIEEWSDDQQRLFKDYEKRLAKKQEEVAAKRKQFQQELQTLQKENQEIAKAFDLSLQELMNDRLGTQQSIYVVELRVIKLLHIIVLQEERQRRVKKLLAACTQAEERATHATAQANTYRDELEDKQSQLRTLQEDERQRERSIKTQQPFLDAHEHAETLIKIYTKSRQKKKTTDRPQKRENEKGGGRNKRAVEDALTMDPFAFVEREEEQKRDAKIAQEQAAAAGDTKIERNENIPADLWQAFLEYRQARLDAERDIRKLGDDTTDMQSHYQTLTSTEEQMRKTFEKSQQEIEKFNEQTELGWYNADVLMMVKQGKVEVEQKAVVSNYKDAILLHRDRITELNAIIRKSGEGKVEILEDMKRFKKGIRLIEWQNEMLEYMISTLEMEHKHLHTLRVTKQMQEFIKGGGEGHNESARAALLTKIEQTATTMQAKIEEKKALITRFKRMIKEKESENAILKGHVSDVQVLVTDRKNIVDLQTADLDQERNDRRMKLLRATRRLEDTAKTQQSEMNVLKKEIDRLRERTFPSFAVVSKRVVGNPDEMKSTKK